MRSQKVGRAHQPGEGEPMSDLPSRRDVLIYGTVLGVAGAVVGPKRALGARASFEIAAIPIFSALVEAFMLAPGSQALQQRASAVVRAFASAHSKDAPAQMRADALFESLLELEPGFLARDPSSRYELLRSLQFAGEKIAAPPFSSFAGMKAMLMSQLQGARGTDVIGAGKDPWELFARQDALAARGYGAKPRLSSFSVENLERQRLFQGLKELVDHSLLQVRGQELASGRKG